MKFAKIAGILAATISSLALFSAEFTAELKLKGSKTQPVSAAFEDADGNKTPVRFYGRTWGPVQIGENGSLFRFKAAQKQYLTVGIALQNRSFTFSAWAKADSVADTNAIVVNTTRPPCWGLVLKKHPANDDLMIADIFHYWNVPGYPGALLRCKGNLTKSDWHLYTCVFDRENEFLFFYVDGKLSDKVKMPKETPAFRDTLTIGGGNGFFDGSLRDVRFIPAALSAEQVAALFAATTPADGE